MSNDTATAPGAPGDYRERLTVPWYAALMCLLAGVCVAAVSIAFLAPSGVLLVAFGTTAACGALAWRMGAVVEVSSGRLRAGRASIPVGELGKARALDAAHAARLRGRDIDPAAFHLIRSWVGTAVVVEVGDPHDPAPYWFISTRHPARLVEALTTARHRRAPGPSWSLLVPPPSPG